MVNGFAPGRSTQDKIMTTASWPVPYYNRTVKAYPLRGQLNREEERHLLHVGQQDVQLLRRANDVNVVNDRGGKEGS